MKSSPKASLLKKAPNSAARYALFAATAFQMGCTPDRSPEKVVKQSLPRASGVETSYVVPPCDPKNYGQQIAADGVITDQDLAPFALQIREDLSTFYDNTHIAERITDSAADTLNIDLANYYVVPLAYDEEMKDGGTDVDSIIHGAVRNHKDEILIKARTKEGDGDYYLLLPLQKLVDFKKVYDEAQAVMHLHDIPLRIINTADINNWAFPATEKHGVYTALHFRNLELPPASLSYVAGHELAHIKINKPGSSIEEERAADSLAFMANKNSAYGNLAYLSMWHVRQGALASADPIAVLKADSARGTDKTHPPDISRARQGFRIAGRCRNPAIFQENRRMTQPDTASQPELGPTRPAPGSVNDTGFSP